MKKTLKRKSNITTLDLRWLASLKLPAEKEARNGFESLSMKNQ
jgi:hypothetical protein